MSVRSAQSITVLFTTRVWSTGVGTNADSLPAGTLYLNGTANGATVTVTNISTGLYKAAVTLPTLAVGDEVELIIAATVSTIADTAIIWGDTKDVVIDSSGLVDANAVKVGPTGSGTAQTARDLGLALPAVAPGGSGGVLISGTNSGTTTLGALTVTGATTLTGNVALAAGLTIHQSTLNGTGFLVTGNGTGAAVQFGDGSLGAQGLLIKAHGAAAAWEVDGDTGNAVNWSATNECVHIESFSGGAVVIKTDTSGVALQLTTSSGDAIQIQAGGGARDIALIGDGKITGSLTGSVASVTAAGGDTSGTTTLLARLTATRAGKLDSLTFTTPNVIDCGIAYVNGIKVNGAGTLVSPWGP